MAGKQRRISQLYTFLASAYDAQDFPEVYSSGTNVTEFVNHASNFALEVKKDREKFDVYLSEINTLESEIKAFRSIDQAFADKYKVSLKDYQEQYGGPQLAQLDEYLEATGKSQATLLNAQVGYVQSIDAKSKEFLDGWEKVKDNAKKDLIWSSIFSVVDILTGVGIGGAGAVYLVYRDVSKMTTARKWWDVGTNGGDVVDLASVAMNTYNYFDKIEQMGINKTAPDVINWITNKVGNITGDNGNFSVLVKKLTEHAKWAKEEDERRSNTPPNPFVPI